MAKALDLSLGWFILSISMPTMDRGRFSRHFLLSVDKMCFPFFSLWEFSEKMLTWTILSQNGEGPDPIFLVTLLSISRPKLERGRFFPHFLLSVGKMCFSFFSLWEFSEKMLTCSISSQNGEGPDPIFLVIYTFYFNNRPGSIFQPLPSIRG